MASLPAYITQDDDDLDMTMDNLSLDEAKEEKKKKLLWLMQQMEKMKIWQCKRILP